MLDDSQNSALTLPSSILDTETDASPVNTDVGEIIDLENPAGLERVELSHSHQIYMNYILPVLLTLDVAKIAAASALMVSCWITLQKSSLPDVTTVLLLSYVALPWLAFTGLVIALWSGDAGLGDPQRDYDISSCLASVQNDFVIGSGFDLCIFMLASLLYGISKIIAVAVDNNNNPIAQGIEYLAPTLLLPIIFADGERVAKRSLGLYRHHFGQTTGSNLFPAVAGELTPLITENDRTAAPGNAR